MTDTLTINGLDFELRPSPNRKTIQLTVDRGGDLVLCAPEGTSKEVLETFVREKEFWLYTKLAEKEALQKPTTRKEFVSGEGFPYLGRTYRLLLVDDQDSPLKLDHGRFRLLRAESLRGQEHFIQWYTAHARSWLARRVERYAGRIGAKPTGFEIRDLGFRWGSCTERGTVNFHWATVLLPPHTIDYILVHELVHLLEPNHTPDFWQRIERVLPDYEERKRWLAELGGEFVTL